MNEDLKILSNPFDLETHKKHFIAYFEAVILPNGEVLYAIPSHAEIIYKIYMKQNNMSRKELYDYMLKKHYCFTDLAREIRVVICWFDKEICNFKITKEQKNRLDQLKENGIMLDTSKL